jgi:LysR family glycine cleavage system transcriptional activator
VKSPQIMPDRPSSSSEIDLSNDALISAAAAGLGIALVPRFFVDEARLAQLGLILLLDKETPPDAAYYLVSPTELSHGTSLEHFK